MAVSDDISERVANVLFEYLLRSANYVTDTAPNAIGAVGKAGEKAFSSVESFAKELIQQADSKRYLEKDGEISAAELNQAVKRLKSHARTIRIGDSDAKDFEAMLHAEKVLYAKIDMRDDNCKMFMYMDKDEEKIDSVSTALHARRGTVTELAPNLFIRALQPAQTLTVQGLDNVELELFRHYARETGALFTVVSRPDGNMLVVPAEDAQKARRALTYAGWVLTGVDGARIRQQVEHRLKGRSAINISAEEGQRELYVVSRLRPDNYVRISSEDYKIYKANKQVATVSRSADNFRSRCVAACEGLTQPVVLSAEEYAEMNVQTLSQAVTTDLFPQDFDDQVEMSILNRLRDLVSQKMALDNEGNSEIDVTDPSITYAEFAVYETLTDEEERQGREKEFEHYKRAQRYSKDHYVFADVNRTGGSLDFIVAQAEAKKREILGENAREMRQNGPSRGNQNDLAVQ